MPIISPTAISPHRIGGKSWSSYWTPQFQAVLDAMTVKPSNQNKYIWSRMVYKLVQKGYWNRFDVFDFMGVHAASESLLNWKNPGTFNPALENIPTFEVYKGYTGNGVNQCINLNYNPAVNGVNYKADQASIYIVSQTANSQAGCEVGMNIGGARIEANLKYSDNTMYAGINTTNNSVISNNSVSGKGHHFIFRSPVAPAPPAYMPKLYGGTWQRRIFPAVYSETPALPNGNLYALARNNGASRDRFSTKQLTLIAIGDFFNPEEQNEITDIVEEALVANNVGLLPYTIAASYPAEKSIINLTTYDGSNQTIHPAVVDCGSAWNGYRYWMANTPFISGGGGPNIENPSIWASNDGITWVVPNGLVNPVVPKPASFNSDCDLYFENNTMYLIWNEWVSTYARTYQLKSTDGITWTDKVLLINPGDGLGDTTCTSPALIKFGATYYIYYVDIKTSDGTYYNIKRRSCATVNGTFANPEVVTFAGIFNLASPRYWHLDITLVGSTLYLFAGTGGSSALKTNFVSIGKSLNGTDFTVETSPPVYVTESSESKGFYRPSGIIIGSNFYLYYSCSNGSDQWLTKRVRLRLI